MSVQTVCFGWHWLPYRYTRTADDVDGARVPRSRTGWAISGAARSPTRTATRGRGRVPPRRRADQLLRRAGPWACTRTRTSAARAGRLAEPRRRLRFRFGNPETRGQPYTDIELRSGDLFVFGGPPGSRTTACPAAGTADPATGLAAGRLNLTLRETGLQGVALTGDPSGREPGSSATHSASVGPDRQPVRLAPGGSATVGDVTLVADVEGPRRLPHRLTQTPSACAAMTACGRDSRSSERELLDRPRRPGPPDLAREDLGEPDRVVVAAMPTGPAPACRQPGGS